MVELFIFIINSPIFFFFFFCSWIEAINELLLCSLWCFVNGGSFLGCGWDLGWIMIEMHEKRKEGSSYNKLGEVGMVQAPLGPTTHQSTKNGSPQRENTTFLFSPGAPLWVPAHWQATFSHVAVDSGMNRPNEQSSSYGSLLTRVWIINKFIFLNNFLFIFFIFHM